MELELSKTILVTGGAGFIGSHFVEQIVAAGHTAVVLDLLTYAGHPINLEQIQDKERLHLVVGNICDGNLVKSLFDKFKIESVVNFAAESHVDRSIDGPAPFI